MENTITIIEESVRRNVMTEQLQMLQRLEKKIPNSVEYDMRRYAKQTGWQVDDVGMMAYNYVGKNSDENYIELRFCMAGNAYCSSEECVQDYCTKANLKDCNGNVNTLDIYSFRFTASYLKQFLTTKAAVSDSETYLSFNKEESVTFSVPLCNKNRVILQSLFNHRYTGAIENIYVNSQIQFLLVYSMDCLFGDGDRDKVYQCKFLEDENGRQTIIRARELLLEHIGNPITIKELSRKVATNECYLKKGFKEMFGTTIFDFYQGQRMEHAKYLLYDKSLSVTDVSALLGYSSISHFSTAFKKHTGLKPCELLNR